MRQHLRLGESDGCIPYADLFETVTMRAAMRRSCTGEHTPSRQEAPLRLQRHDNCASQGAALAAVRTLEELVREAWWMIDNAIL